MNPSPGRQNCKVLFRASLLYAPARAFPQNRCWFTRRGGRFARFCSRHRSSMLPPALFPKTAVGFPARQVDSQGSVPDIGSLYFRPGELSEPQLPFWRMMCPQSSAGSDFFPFCWSGILAISYPRSCPFCVFSCRGEYLLRMCAAIFLRIGGKKAFFFYCQFLRFFRPCPRRVLGDVFFLAFHRNGNIPLSYWECKT